MTIISSGKRNEPLNQHTMKSLFVSTDFSAAGDNAVKFAAHLAIALESRLVVFHAAHLPSFNPTIDEVELAQLKLATEREKKDILDEVVSKIYKAEGLPRSEDSVMVASKIGAFAAEAIMAAAKEEKADLIVVGTHGASGLKLLGGNTADVIFNAESPVLAIPPQSAYRKMDTLVYATDLRNTLNELRCIVPIASRLKAVVEVLNLDFGQTGPGRSLEVEHIKKELKYEKIEVVIQKEMKGMSVLEQLEKYLEWRQPDMLVMFPEERSVLDKIFVRSKTEGLIYHAKFPLMTFRKSHIDHK